ncbi:type II toxin-antitoxin system RelE/ParE family toxin [Candidatus Woesearchaeota archaeon]|nr:type II toxin-antitoxin system RelE/ParE family toxin [Candidatus Woesearchaeota archaeon]
MFEIYYTDEFEKKFRKLDTQLQEEVKREISQLESNPFGGKPMGYPFFREKRVRELRVYYLIYEDYVIVFVVSLSGKKDQQKTIDTIKELIPYYREEIKKLLKS